jgi:replicative DNA helicase
MTASKPKYTLASDAMESWRQDVMTGRAPTLHPIGSGNLGRIEVGPGLVTLIGGAPGAGKTAFTMQAVVDAMRITPTLRVLVANCEMSASALLDRQLARLSGIDLTTIRHRRLGAEHGERLNVAMDALDTIGDRLAFLRPPFSLRNIAESADAAQANLIVVDYVQRFDLGGQGDETRGRVNMLMNVLRQFADAGVAVIVVSAVGRTKDKKGRNSYAGEGLNLASFRESSELEFGADDAFILHPADDGTEGRVVCLRHLKSRHGECRDIRLIFDRPRQSFESPGGAAQSPGRVTKSLEALWNRTAAAEEDDDDG